MVSDGKKCILFIEVSDVQLYIYTLYPGGYLCPVGLVLPISSEGERFVRLDDINDHSCPRVVQLGEWIRNFSDFSANCSFDFRWKGKCVCHTDLETIRE